MGYNLVMRLLDTIRSLHIDLSVILESKSSASRSILSTMGLKPSPGTPSWITNPTAGRHTGRARMDAAHNSSFWEKPKHERDAENLPKEMKDKLMNTVGAKAHAEFVAKRAARLDALKARAAARKS